MSFRRNPSKYGVSSSHADEDALPTATQTSFFQKGREFESRYVNHHYTQEEREKLGTFESVDYLPPHSAVYKVCQVCILLVQLVKYLFCLTSQRSLRSLQGLYGNTGSFEELLQLTFIRF